MEEAVPQLGELIRRSRGKKKEKPQLKKKNSPLVKVLAKGWWTVAI